MVTFNQREFNQREFNQREICRARQVCGRGVTIIETLTLRLPERKFRLWQRFDGKDLESVMVIREPRLPDEVSEPWW